MTKYIIPILLLICATASAETISVKITDYQQTQKLCGYPQEVHGCFNGEQIIMYGFQEGERSYNLNVEIQDWKTIGKTCGKFFAMFGETSCYKNNTLYTHIYTGRQREQNETTVGEIVAGLMGFDTSRINRVRTLGHEVLHQLGAND